jgi:hypothetical protein
MLGRIFMRDTAESRPQYRALHANATTTVSLREQPNAKDFTKVDRSSAYAALHESKNIVAIGLRGDARCKSPMLLAWRSVRQLTATRMAQTYS